MSSPSQPLCKQGKACHDQRVRLHRLRQEKQIRQQMHLSNSFSGFSGCSVAFTCFFPCCWAVSGSLHLRSPNSSLVHLSLLFQRLRTFSCQILTSPSTVPLPIAHSFLYYKHNTLSRDGGKKTLLSLLVFFQEYIDLPFPRVSKRSEKHSIK